MRPVAQYSAEGGEMIAMFPSITDAGRMMYGKAASNAVSIRSCAVGEQKTACGFRWKFCKKEDYLEYLNEEKETDA